jgi:NAD kinase/NaMN:DMB phosphoribosyltransferase
MAAPSDADIRAHLAALAAPAAGLGELHHLAERLCQIQRTLAPVTAPRRLVLFAADHGTPVGAADCDPNTEPCDVSATLREVLAGGSASAVLARAHSTELLVVDVGTWGDVPANARGYRARKVRATEERTELGLTEDEFRAALAAGHEEAESASKEGAKVVALDALGTGSAKAARCVGAALDQLQNPTADPVAALAGAAGVDLAAGAGFVARAAELGLAVLVDGTFATASALVAERLFPGTSAKVIQREPGAALAPPWSEFPRGRMTTPTEGVGALMAVPLLDAAAAVVSRASKHEPKAAIPAAPKGHTVAVFTGSFDPPTAYHRRAAKRLRESGFDEVIVRPTGPRADRPDAEHADPIHRATMVDLAFRDIPGVSVDLSDLDDGVFTPQVAFADLYAKRGEVWHVVSDEFLHGARSGQSTVHTKWELGADMWTSARFAVLHPDECRPDSHDRPPRCRLVSADGHVPTADIRMRVFQGGSARPDVPELVEAYIRRYGLFSGQPTPRETRIKLADTRLKLFFDPRNAKASALAAKLKRYESNDPTHIVPIGGDGTMLQAIRDHWRMRLPFVGLNGGTLGFLMNESLPDQLDGTELQIYRMPMLRVDTEAGLSTERTSSLACGDAWVERESGQAAWVDVAVDGRVEVEKVVGDGLLVATPVGSSSYARAMGATPVPLTAPVLTLAGSNVFRPRFWRPITLPEGSTVTISSLKPNNKPGYNEKRPIRGFVDGREIGVVKWMRVRVSTVAAVELAFTPAFNLASRVLQSMFPPAEML